MKPDRGWVLVHNDTEYRLPDSATVRYARRRIEKFHTTDERSLPLAFSLPGTSTVITITINERTRVIRPPRHPPG